MAENSEMKYKSNTMLKVMKALVFDFVLYFVTVWQSAFYMSIQHRVLRNIHYI